MRRFILIGLLFFCLAPLSLQAHKANQSYIYLRVYENDGIEGRFVINVEEINKQFGTSFDRNASMAEIQPYINDLKAYLLKNTRFSSQFGSHKIVMQEETTLLKAWPRAFVRIYFKLDNSKVLPDNLDVYYNGFFEKDDTHRGFVLVEYNWKAGIINNEANISLDFGPGDTSDTLSLTEASVWKGFIAMVKQGIWHIWIGIDHILFLLALILPSVVRRRKRSTNTLNTKEHRFPWVPVERFRPAFLYVIKIITFFTIAHTITLTLASLELVNLPAQLVESVIALSIGLAAYHNIRPIFNGKDWVIAFVFGLFHGFGFASVLGDLGLTGEFLTLSLLGFNVGVEIGQLVIIAMIFPVLYLIRNLKLYPKILFYGSIVLIIISLYWGIERGFDVNLGAEDYLKSIVIKILKFLNLR